MAISFSAGVKAEVCRFAPAKTCCAVAECFGILLFCNSFGPDGVRIITESRDFALRLPKLFKKAFSMNFDVRPMEDSVGKQVFMITEQAKCHLLMET